MKTTQEAPSAESWGLSALSGLREAKRQHQNAVADDQESWIKSNRYYYDGLKSLLSFIVEPGKRVLNVRCENGDLLASLEPSYGVGIEIGETMVEKASRAHPELRFVKADPEHLNLDEQFDYIIFNHISDTVDILATLERLRQHSGSHTRIVFINYNPLWRPIVEIANKLGLRDALIEPVWASEGDVRTFLSLAGFQAVRTHRLFLMPKRIPLISNFMNEVV